MEDPITRAEYEEYQKRMEQEDHRQNRRIEQLEETTKQINALTVSIENWHRVLKAWLGSRRHRGNVSCLWKAKTEKCGEKSLVM